MNEPKLVTLRLVHPLFAYFRTVHNDVLAVLNEFALQPQAFFELERQIAEPTLFAIFQRIAEITGDPIVGLRAAARVDVDAIPLLQGSIRYPVMQLLVASDTVGEGLARFSQYYPLAHPGAKVSLKISDGIAKFGFPTDQPKDSDGSTGRRIFIEYMLGILSQVLRGLGTRPVVPCEVFFSQREPAFADEYTRFFGAPVRFGAAEDGFALGSAQLAIRLRTANPAMLQKLEEHLAQLQAKHAALQTLSGQVRCAVESALQERIPSAEKVAKQLGMSVRTLTRRLDAEGTSYKKLLDEVRAALAARYLHDGKHSAEQVALLLGFSETSAFLRAFKRWHGTSLTEYRRKPDEQAISADHLPRRKSRN